MSTDTPIARDAAADDDELVRFVWTRRAGETIFAQGEFGAELFIVEAGEVELLTVDPDGTAQRRAVLTAGESFGERALLDEQARELTARALTDCRLIRLDYATLVELIREKPLIGVQLLRRQVRRVRWLDGASPATTAAPSASAQAAAHSQTIPAPGAPAAAADSAPASSEAARPSLAASKLPASAAASASAPVARQGRFSHKESGLAFVVPDEGEAIVGRIDRATGLAPAIDFTELDRQRSLSRRHARIERAPGGFHLREEPGVGNGTFVNDRRVAAGQAVLLRDGDRVRFGMVETVFQLS